jgi:hypothetical protein
MSPTRTRLKFRAQDCNRVVNRPALPTVLLQCKTWPELVHTTDLVEHTELVADRLIAFADVVGRENVIAGIDCGLGGRVHPQIAWAKLRALRELRSYFEL